MAIGMSYEEYWYAEPYRVVEYYKAHEMKREMKNQEMWIQGMYFYDALSVVVGNAFGKQKEKYVDKPFDLYPKKQNKKQIEAQEEIIKHFSKFKVMWDLQHKE